MYPDSSLHSEGCGAMPAVGREHREVWGAGSRAAVVGTDAQCYGKTQMGDPKGCFRKQPEAMAWHGETSAECGDVGLKVVLGDLSGLSSLNGGTNPWSSPQHSQQKGPAATLGPCRCPDVEMLRCPHTPPPLRPHHHWDPQSSPQSRNALEGPDGIGVFFHQDIFSTPRALSPVVVYDIFNTNFLNSALI